MSRTLAEELRERAYECKPMDGFLAVCAEALEAQTRQIDKFGLALMMIREGAADPCAVADEALEKFNKKGGQGVTTDPSIYDVPTPQEVNEVRASESADAVCHDDQMTVWADEVKEHLYPHLREPLDYEDVLSLDSTVKDAIRHVVKCAFSHPALNTPNKE